MKSKKVAVLFSGGLDSTYLVWKNLKDGNEVKPVYIEIQNNEAKTILEKNRIELLYKEFENDFNTNERKICRINYAVSAGVHAYGESLYFKQIPIWIFGMVFLQSLAVDEIQVGYVANDDAISYLNDIQKIYKSYQSICEPMIELKFPITKMKKWQMARELPKKYLNLTITCENPTIIGSKNEKFVEYEPCCECDPCKKIISSNYYETHEFPYSYEKGIIREYAKSLYSKGYRIIDKNGNDYFGVMNVKDENISPYQLKIPFEEFMLSPIEDFEIESK